MFYETLNSSFELFLVEVFNDTCLIAGCRCLSPWPRLRHDGRLESWCVPVSSIIRLSCLIQVEAEGLLIVFLLDGAPLRVLRHQRMHLTWRTMQAKPANFLRILLKEAALGREFVEWATIVSLHLLCVISCSLRWFVHPIYRVHITDLLLWYGLENDSVFFI